MRDGGQRQTPAADVVVGGVLVLGEGDIVPADARVVEAVALLADEAALTGEAAPVGKAAGIPGDIVSAGRVIVRGHGQRHGTGGRPAGWAPG